MGANYYVDGIHIGKASAGWEFLFALHRECRDDDPVIHFKHYHDVKSLRRWLKGKVITNSEGNKFTSKEFWDMVESRRGKKKHDDEGILSICGYLFCDTYFR